MAITPDILKKFKERMHFDEGEDDNLMDILIKSEESLLRICGNYDIEIDKEFEELVFERSRYVYNDALEYFTKNFRTEINSLSIEKAIEETRDKDATI